MKRGADKAGLEDLENLDGQPKPKIARPVSFDDFMKYCRSGDLEGVNDAIESQSLAPTQRFFGVIAVNYLFVGVIAKNDFFGLRLAAENGHLAVVNRLLEFKVVRDNIATLGNAALRRAAQNGHLAVVNRLFEFQAVRDNITAVDNAALRWAAENGHLAVVKRLLEVDNVRELANRTCGLNHDAGVSIDQQINILLIILAQSYPRLKKSLDIEIACVTTHCISMNKQLPKIPTDLQAIIAGMILHQRLIKEIVGEKEVDVTGTKLKGFVTTVKNAPIAQEPSQKKARNDADSVEDVAPAIINQFGRHEQADADADADPLQPSLQKRPRVGKHEMRAIVDGRKWARNW